MKAILLIGHGSKRAGFEKPLEKVARRLKKIFAGSRFWVGCAYLEITSPSIPEAIDQLAGKDIHEIVLVPYFLLEGLHVKKDIPLIAKTASKKYKGKLNIYLAPYLGYDEMIAKIVWKRVRKAKSI